MKNYLTQENISKIIEKYLSKEQAVLLSNLLIYQKRAGYYSPESKRQWFVVYEDKMYEWFEIDKDNLEVNINGLANLHYIKIYKRKSKAGKVYYTVLFNWELIFCYFANIINNVDKLD